MIVATNHPPPNLTGLVVDFLVRQWTCLACRPDMGELEAGEDDDAIGPGRRTIEDRNDLQADPPSSSLMTLREDDPEILPTTTMTMTMTMTTTMTTTTMLDSDTIDDMPPLPLTFPMEELSLLRRRHGRMQSATTTTTRPGLGWIHRPPIACGIVQCIQLLGIFPTTRWLDGDPTMHPDVKELFGGSSFCPLGEYRVADVNAVDGAGTVHRLTFIVNTGVEGLMTGYWGAVFAATHKPPTFDAPVECWARFETTGPHETTVREEFVATTGDGSGSGSGVSSSRSSSRRRFQPLDDSLIDFCDEYFQGGRIPGRCATQLERILGIIAQFLLELEWDHWLPSELLQARDTLGRSERKRRARIARYEKSKVVAAGRFHCTFQQ